MAIDRETRRRLRAIQHEIRDIINTDTVEIEVELDDDVAQMVLQECARLDITPNELIEEAVQRLTEEVEEEDSEGDDDA